MNSKRTTPKNFGTLEELYRAEKYRSAPRLHKLINLLYLAYKYRRNVGGEDIKYMTSAFDQLINNLHEEIDQARYAGQTLRQHGIFKNGRNN